jgi:LmbE family N-acetylglucosaminyl deacetylase
MEVLNTKGVKVLTVFAHPDDDELTCLGSLRKFIKNGADVTLLEITRGENSHGEPANREGETRKVADLVGYTLCMENFSDGAIVYDVKLISIIDRYLNNIRPEIVITHFPQTLGLGHQDHEAVASAVTNASRRKNYVQCILYAEPPTTNENFIPNLFIDITDYITLKKNAIKKHKSEKEKEYISLETLEYKGRWWSYQAHPHYFNSQRYFEAFLIVKCIFA